MNQPLICFLIIDPIDLFARVILDLINRELGINPLNCLLDFDPTLSEFKGVPVELFVSISILEETKKEQSRVWIL